MIGKVFYNAGSQLVGKGFTAGATLLVTIFIGRALGPQGFGEFTKIFVYVGYFYIVTDFGLNSIFVKGAQEKSLVSSLKVLVGLRLSLSLVLALLAVLIASFLPYDPNLATGFSPTVKIGIALASLTIVTHALYTTANAFFQKKLRYDLSTIAAIVASTVVLLVTIAVSARAASPLPYVFAYVAGGATLVFVAYLLIRQKSGEFVLPVFDLGKFKESFSSAWPIGLALIFNLIYFRIDVFILASVRPSGEVGLYGLAYQFFEATLAVPIFFANAIFPLLIQSYKRGLGPLRAQLAKWLGLMFLVSLVATVLLFGASFLIPAIYDSRFEGSGAALQILALGLPFFFISVLLWHLLIIYEKQRYLIPIYGFGAAFNLVANLLLIPIWGYLAAAAITVVSEAIILVLLALVSIRMIFPPPAEERGEHGGSGYSPSRK